MTGEPEGRRIVFERSGGACEVCARAGHSVHHRVKPGQRGTWAPSNLLRVCGDGTTGCHGWIESHPRHAFALGLWVPAGEDPRVVPAYLAPGPWPRGWYRLDDDGCLAFSDPLPDLGADSALGALAADRL